MVSFSCVSCMEDVEESKPIYQGRKINLIIQD